MLPTTNVGPSKPRAPEPVSDAASGGGYGPVLHPAPPKTPNPAAATAAASTNSSYQQYQNYLKSNMGRQPSLLDQLTQPIIDSYRAQASAGDAQIKGMTDIYAKQLGGIASQANADYQAALGNQNQIDLATAQGLQGNLTQAANTIQQSLALAGQDTSPASQAAADASSTAGSLFASGTAGVSALNQEAAAQAAYGKNLQGLAALSGIQAISSYNAGLTKDEQQAVADAQKLVPSILNAQANQENADTRRAQAQISLANAKTKANAPHIYGSGTTGYFALMPDGRNVQLTAPGERSIKTFSSGGNEYALNPSTGQVQQLTSNPKAGPKDQVRNSRGGIYDVTTGKWLVPPTGGKGGKAGAALTPGEAQSYLKSISHTSTHKDPTSGQYVTTTSHTTNYQTAYKYLRTHGVGDVQARTLLDSTYKRGEDGRAWLTNEEQSILKRVSARMQGPGASAQTTTIHKNPTTGRAYLSQQQRAILAQNGHLPPGAWGTDPAGQRVWYIAN